MVSIPLSSGWAGYSAPILTGSRMHCSLPCALRFPRCQRVLAPLPAVVGDLHAIVQAALLAEKFEPYGEPALGLAMALVVVPAARLVEEYLEIENPEHVLVRATRADEVKVVSIGAAFKTASTDEIRAVCWFHMRKVTTVLPSNKPVPP